MKVNCRLSHCFFFLCLLAGLSWQTLADSPEVSVTLYAEKTCLTGWLPLWQNRSSSCLQVVRCFDENDDFNADNKTLPLVTEDTCPLGLHRAMASDPNVAAMVNIHKGRNTRSEYLSVSSWFYGWSAANFGMSILHSFKASQKARMLHNGNTSNKNLYFFASYMIGAFHHIVEMPVIPTAHFITRIPHLMIHSGTLILSIIERLQDCNCCSQFKNGHNTMIVFHILGLVVASLR